MSKIKTFRNVAVVSMATAVGLGVVGGDAVTVAWYQYSTRATTSIIGTAVAETGVIQVSKTGADNTWKRDLITKELIGTENPSLTPVTFGALNADGSLPAKAYKDADASENAYATHPGAYDEVYKEAVLNKDYIQYDFYLKAEKEGNKVALPVYLSDILIENFGPTLNANFYKSLRVHLAVDENNDSTVERNLLLSTEGETIALYGQLNLGNSLGEADVVGGYEGNLNRDDEVIYGNEGEFQTALRADALESARQADGNYNEPREKVILNTQEDAISKVTVTVWCEGWDHQIGEETIKVKNEVYRRVEALYGEDLADKNLFVVDGDGKYVLQTSGRAEADKHYYSLQPKVEVERAVSEDPVSVNGLYTLNGTTFEPASGDSVAETKYYSISPEEPNLLRKDAPATQSVANYYIFDGVKYVKCNSDVDTDDNYKLFKKDQNYFELASEKQYVVEAVADADEFDEKKANLFVLNAGEYEPVGAAAYDNTATYYVLDRIELDVPVWNGQASINNQQFRFGLTFDVGADAFANK